MQTNPRLLVYLCLVTSLAVPVTKADADELTKSSTGLTSKTGTIHGTVIYRERMLLPPTSVVSVKLLDVSLMDVPATVIASTEFSTAGAPPYRFSIEYPVDKIADSRTYSVSARIENDDQLLFITDSHNPPDFVSDQPIDLVLKRVNSKPVPAHHPSRKPDASLTNTYWKIVNLKGNPVEVHPNQREPHFVLQTDGIARGHLGCNSFSGGYETGDGVLSFKGLRVTLMACPEGMKQERALSQALGKVARMNIEGDTLMLSDGAHNGLIYCEAVYLP